MLMRPSRFAFLLLLAIAPVVRAQTAVGRVVALLVDERGRTLFEGGTIILYRDSTEQSGSISKWVTGQGVVFDSVPAGAHLMDVRRIGYKRIRQVVQTSAGTDTVTIRMIVAYDPRAIDSAAHADYRRKLALARARPRHWTCERDSATVHEYALRWAWLSSTAARDVMLGLKPRWGIPTTGPAFVEQFRPITDPGECARIVARLDDQYGMIDDHLAIFRVGDVYLLAERSGAIVDLTGKIIVGFIF
jgi:hypothetical protein